MKLALATPLHSLTGRRVLLLNWRGPSHPEAGGAEVFCWAVATSFAAAGIHVTLFTAGVRGQPSDEVRDGVRIIRRGRQLSLYARAAGYLLRNRGAFDAIIDMQNGIPFFAPLFAGRSARIVPLIHHVHQDQFRQHFPWPASAVGRFLEGPMARIVYGSRPVVVVSPSTRQAVRRTLGLRGPLHVVPNGAVIVAPLPGGGRAAVPTIVSVSRLAIHKRLDLLVGSIPGLLVDCPELRVEIAGDGPQRAELEALAVRLKVDHRVRFHGQVSSVERDRLVASAWLAVVPSDAEGWCLTVIEANAAGIPVVGRRVPGLRDSILPGVTGWLAEGEEDFGAVLGEAIAAVTDPAEAARWSALCRRWASHFSWDGTVARLAAVISAELTRPMERASQRWNSDLGSVIEFEVNDVDRFRGLAVRALRATDAWAISGNQVRVLLHGCDDRDAVATMTRMGYPDARAVRVALDRDLLVGPLGTEGWVPSWVLAA